MNNPGATGKWYWTLANPKGPAAEPVELVRPDGTLAGVQLRTLENGWGQYQDRDRLEVEKRIIRLLNEEDPHGHLQNRSPLHEGDRMTSKVIPYSFYKSPSTGRTFSIFSSWRLADCELVTCGFTVEHPDGTRGLGRKPFGTEAEAQAWVDAHPNFPGMNQG